MLRYFDQLQFITLFRRFTRRCGGGCASVWGRENMQDIGEKADSSGGYLSQLKNFYRNTSFAQKGLFSGLAFFSIGLTGVLPVAPESAAGVFAGQEMTRESTESKEKTDTSTGVEERCRLQEDVRFFSALGEGKSAAYRTEIPCEEKMIAETAEAPEIDPASSDTALDDTIREMTAGYPIESMATAIAKYDREVAGLIIGIAKKESNWGKRVPRDSAGADCFNYWGYKGAGARGVAMGHGCFGSPEEAVTAIGNRLAKLVDLRETSAPENMIVWKCGSSCKGHSDESVKKWIADVSLYYDRIVVR